MLTIRPIGLLLGAAALALLAVACSADADSWAARDIALDPGAPLQPILVNSQLGVGANRIAFGFFDPEGQLVSDVTASVGLYVLDGADGSLVSEHELTPVTLSLDAMHMHEDGSDHVHSGPDLTMFVTTTQFDRAGDWGAELSLVRDGEQTESRVRITVLERTSEPMIGESIPRSVQRVLRDVDDISEIDTSVPPNPEMHELTVAEALDSGRPVVIAFATPLFCQTRFCGPVLDVAVRPLMERYRGEVEFVHIEPLDLAEAREGRLVAGPEMVEWALTTEPWVFVIDGSGRVAGKFEGITSAEEVEAALIRAIEATP